MRILIEPKKDGNVIVTTAIGAKYVESWQKYASENWETYCKKYDIGLIIFDEDLINENDNNWKKPYWQKLLIGKFLKQHTNFRGNVCFIDTDIIINPSAPNIFDTYDPLKIALVSQKKNLPYPLDEVLRRIAFFRHHYMDTKYPLDSYLFASINQIFELHRLPSQEDFACTGLFLFNVENHAELFEGWYNEYATDMETVDGGTEEVHLNYEIQSHGKVQWLDYRFQALWIYEMAWKYPFLYKEINNIPLVETCIEASLFTNYFLHFAGAWEGDMWKTENLLRTETAQFNYREFEEYMKTPVYGKPKGIIKP